MNIDALADLIKARGCDEVCYFHADHFEPWSRTIDDTLARAVDHFAVQTQKSPYARRLSLFYRPFVRGRHLGTAARKEGDRAADGDEIVFVAQTPGQAKLARETIGPLSSPNAHEFHLHVHHEYWTRNGSQFDQPVAKWVNEHSTPQADHRRMDLHLELCKETIAREIGAPFERWGFVHGNWALNASDPAICCISDEISLIMKHGGYGDFSFPAGRSYCDPKLLAPFTCLPIDMPRAYDHPRSSPRPIGLKAGALRPHRFLIWNSPIKANHSSLDYYSPANVKLFETPEAVLEAWLAKSVCLGGKLYIKTHAHSMRRDYKLEEADALIPHCYPAVVTLFEGLERACERAGVVLRFMTTNEVVNQLSVLDNGSPLVDMAEQKRTPEIVSARPLPSVEVSIEALAEELIGLHRDQMLLRPPPTLPLSLRHIEIANGNGLEPHELSVVMALYEQNVPTRTHIVGAPAGSGGILLVLARLGYTVAAIEGDARRHEACRWRFDRHIRLSPILAERLALLPVDSAAGSALDAPSIETKKKILIAVHDDRTDSPENASAIFKAAQSFDELILDIGSFGESTTMQGERSSIIPTAAAHGYRPVEPLYFKSPRKLWLFRRVS